MKIRLVMAVEAFDHGVNDGQCFEKDVVLEVDDKTAKTLKELVISGDRYGALIIKDVLLEKAPQAPKKVAKKEVAA